MSLQIETLVKIVLFIAVLVFGFLLVSGYILPTQGGVGSVDAINSLCPDWVKVYQCSCSSAASPSLSITVGSEQKTLAQLCAEHFNVQVDDIVSNVNGACDKCKKYPLCGGCPS